MHPESDHFQLAPQDVRQHLADCHQPEVNRAQRVTKVQIDEFANRVNVDGLTHPAIVAMIIHERLHS